MGSLTAALVVIGIVFIASIILLTIILLKDNIKIKNWFFIIFGIISAILIVISVFVIIYSAIEMSIISEIEIMN